MCRSLVQVPKDILADPAATLTISFAGGGLNLVQTRRLADLPKAKPKKAEEGK
jgi:hypothetical protein